MSSYIKITQNSTFPASSNVGKAVIGIGTGSKVTITNSNGVTSLVPESTPPYTASYNAYAAKLEQIQEEIKTSGLLTIGKTYAIDSYVGGDDFSNVADVQSGTINTIDCRFVATGTTPTNWTNGSQISDLNYPIATVIQNTLGFTPYWKDLGSQQFYFNFPESVNPNKVVASISPNSTNNVLSTFDTDPQNFSFWDSTFDTTQPGGNFDGIVRALAAQPDGKVLVGGSFTNYNGDTYSGFIRLLQDGSVDPDFIQSGGGFAAGQVRKIVLQEDGKILVGGDFHGYRLCGDCGTTLIGSIIRLDASGSVDADFNSGDGFTRSAESENASGGNVYDIVVQPDGKIIVGGWFGDYDGTTANRIIRLDASGSIDVDFNSGDGFATKVFGSAAWYDRVSSIALQPDGKIICGGMFTSYNVSSAGRIARLDASGSRDLSFGDGEFDNWVNVVRLQDDGKVVVGGQFNTYTYGDVYNSNFIARLNNSGSYDESFAVGSGFNNYPNDIKIVGGQIIATGWFSTYNGTVNVNRLIKLSDSGSVTSIYEKGFNAKGHVLETQPYGKILVGGEFDTYAQGEVTSPRLIRLYSSYDVLLTNRDDKYDPGSLDKASVEIKQYL